MNLIFSGAIIPVSTIDWYGRSASVVFFNGCNFKCLYCSNNQLIEVANRLEPLFKKGNAVDISDIEKQIHDTKNFISAVVFSGGEPTAHPVELEHLARFAKDQGLLVGIETNGYYPERLSTFIEKKLIDKIFLDIKAPLDDVEQYRMITGGVGDAAEHALRTLNLPIPVEARTTVFRSCVDVPRIAQSIQARDCTYVIQQGIPEYAPDKKIREERPLARVEMIALAQSVSFLKDVRIRTKEKGEERIV